MLKGVGRRGRGCVASVVGEVARLKKNGTQYLQKKAYTSNSSGKSGQVFRPAQCYLTVYNLERTL